MPMLVILFGRVIDVREVQEPKKLLPKLVTPLGRVIDVRDVQE